MGKNSFEVPNSTNAGIYMLYNATKHKAYIGETKNFHSRALSHRQKLQKNEHVNKELQEDFNNQCEFVFAILEDIQESNERLWREKQYILAFRNKGMEVYNHETEEQIMSWYYFYVVKPDMDKIYSGFHNKFGCELLNLKKCRVDTIKKKFRSVKNDAKTQ